MDRFVKHCAILPDSVGTEPSHILQYLFAYLVLEFAVSDCCLTSKYSAGARKPNPVLDCCNISYNINPILTLNLFK